MTIARRAGDLAHMLSRVGVPIVLGGVTTYAKRVALSAEEGDGVAPKHRAQLAAFLIATGSLPALRNGVAFAVDGTAYQVHHFDPESDSVRTRIIAYPTDVAPAALWLSAATLLEWAERGADAEPGPVLDLDALEGYPVALFEAIAAVSGTDPQLVVAVHHADAEAGPFAPSGLSFDPVTDEDLFQVIALDRAGGAVKRYVRLAPAITGTGDPAFWCQAALLDAALPR